MWNVYWTKDLGAKWDDNESPWDPADAWVLFLSSVGSYNLAECIARRLGQDFGVRTHLEEM